MSDPIEIQDVLNLNFNIRPYPEIFADLNRLRREDYLRQLHFWLNYDKEQGKVAQKLPREFKKIIFTGHLGCGKTLELYSLFMDLSQKGRFLCVYVDGETDTRRGEFEWEDFFVLIVKGLAYQIQSRTPERFLALNEIADEWFSQKEVREEISRFFSEKQTGDGNVYWKFLADPDNFKLAYGGNTKTTIHIRKRVKENPLNLVDKLNDLVIQIRDEIRASGEYTDVLFIFDGTEKVHLDKYRELFVENLAAISAINAHVIVTIPIATRYKLDHAAQQGMYQFLILPMCQIETQEEKDIFAQILTKRADKSVFIEDDALNFAVDHSGGCARQFIRIADTAFTVAYGDKIQLEHVRESVFRLGFDMKERLTLERHEILRQILDGHFDFDKLTGKDKEHAIRLIDELYILKYNGGHAINPLLNQFLLNK